MAVKGRIGVITPEIFDPLDYELLTGIHSHGAALGYDVFVFTGVRNTAHSFGKDEYTDGLENIYELVRTGNLDGIIFVAERFYNDTVESRIFSYIKEISVPCVIIGREHEGFVSVYAKQREVIRDITHHVIREHGCKKLYFLSGIENDRNSLERYRGFLDAVKAEGLHFDESGLFYGDFWKEKPKILAEKIASGEIDKPDAVICASDAMAISLCDTLMENGVRVPEDVIITGYDGDWGALTHKPSVTTATGRDGQTGGEAVRVLYRLMTGCESNLPTGKQHIRLGKSCGCICHNVFAKMNEDTFLEEHVESMINRYIDRGRYITVDLIEQFRRVDTFEALVDVIDNTAYIMQGWKTLYICLCDDWHVDFENPKKFRTKGYSEKINCVLSSRFDANNGEQTSFDLSELLPPVDDEPRLVVFTSMHSNRQILGYIAVGYDCVRNISLDEHYINWCDSVVSGFMNVQDKEYRKYVKKQIEELSDIDPETGLYNKRGFLEQLAIARENRDILLLVIGAADDGSKYNGINLTQLTANALRLSAESAEIAGVLDKNIFAVIPSETVPKYAEKRLLRLEQEILRIQGNASSSRKPVFASEVINLDGSSVSEIGRRLDLAVNVVAKTIEGDISEDYRQQLNRLWRDIHSNPQKDWNIDSIMEDLRISRSHFQRLYKDMFGIGCHEDVINARMEKAKELILYTDMRIQEIAELCGYNNDSHFMRQFKKKTGMTAAEYRKNGK